MADTPLASRLDELNQMGQQSPALSGLASKSPLLAELEKWGGGSSRRKKEEEPWTFATGRESSIIEYQRQAERLRAMGIDPDTVDNRRKDPWWTMGLKTLSGLGIMLDWVMMDAPVRSLIGGMTGIIKGEGLSKFVIQGDEVDPYAEEQDYGKGTLDAHAPTGKELLLMWGIKGKDRKGKIDWIDVAGLGTELAISPSFWLTLGGSSAAKAAAKGGTSAIRATSNSIIMTGAKALKGAIDESPELLSKVAAQAGENPSQVTRLLETLITPLIEGDKTNQLIQFAEKMDAWQRLNAKGVLDDIVVDYSKYADDIVDPKNAAMLKRLGAKRLTDEMEIARSALLPSADEFASMVGVSDEATAKSLEKLIGTLSDEAVTSNKAFRELQLRVSEGMGDFGGIKFNALPIYSYMSGKGSVSLVNARKLQEIGQRFGMEDFYNMWQRSLPGRAITRTFVSDWRIKKLAATDEGLAHQLKQLKNAAQAESDNTLHLGINALVQNLSKLSNADKELAMRAIEAPGELLASLKTVLDDSEVYHLQQSLLRTKGAYKEVLPKGVEAVIASARRTLPAEFADALEDGVILTNASDGIRLRFSVVDKMSKLEELARTAHRKSLARAAGLDFVPRAMGNDAAAKGVTTHTSEELDAIGRSIKNTMEAIGDGFDEEGHRILLEAGDQRYLSLSAELYGGRRQLNLSRVTAPLDTEGIDPERMAAAVANLTGGKPLVSDTDTLIEVAKRYDDWTRARIALEPHEKASRVVGLIDEIASLSAARNNALSKLTGKLGETAVPEAVGASMPISGDIADFIANVSVRDYDQYTLLLQEMGKRGFSFQETERAISNRVMELFDLMSTKSTNEESFRMLLDTALDAHAEMVARGVRRTWQGVPETGLLRPVYNVLDGVDTLSPASTRFVLDAASVVDEAERVLDPGDIAQRVAEIDAEPLRTISTVDGMAWSGGGQLPQTLYYQVYDDAVGDGFNDTLSRTGLLTAKIDEDGLPPFPCVRVSSTPVLGATNIPVVARARKVAIVTQQSIDNMVGINSTVVVIRGESDKATMTVQQLIDEGYDAILPTTASEYGAFAAKNAAPNRSEKELFLLPSKDGYERLVAQFRFDMFDQADMGNDIIKTAANRLAEPSENPIIVSWTDKATGETGEQVIVGARAAELRARAPKTWKTLLRKELGVPKGARMNIENADGFVPALRVIDFDPSKLTKLSGQKIADAYKALSEKFGHTYVTDIRHFWGSFRDQLPWGDQPVKLYHATAYLDEVFSGGLKTGPEMTTENIARLDTYVNKNVTQIANHALDMVTPAMYDEVVRIFGSRDEAAKFIERMVLVQSGSDKTSSVSSQFDELVKLAESKGKPLVNHPSIPSPRTSANAAHLANTLEKKVTTALDMVKADLDIKPKVVSGHDSFSNRGRYGFNAATYSYVHAKRRLDAMTAIGTLAVGRTGADDFLTDIFDIYARLLPEATDEELASALAPQLRRTIEKMSDWYDNTTGKGALSLRGQIGTSWQNKLLNGDSVIAELVQHPAWQKLWQDIGNADGGSTVALSVKLDELSVMLRDYLLDDQSMWDFSTIETKVAQLVDDVLAANGIDIVADEGHNLSVDTWSELMERIVELRTLADDERNGAPKVLIELVNEMRRRKKGARGFVDTPMLDDLHDEWMDAIADYIDQSGDPEVAYKEMAREAGGWFSEFEGARSTGAYETFSRLQAKKLEEKGATMRPGSLEAVKSAYGNPAAWSQGERHQELWQQLAEENLIMLSSYNNQDAIVRIGKNPNLGGIVELRVKMRAGWSMDDIVEQSVLHSAGESTGYYPPRAAIVDEFHDPNQVGGGAWRGLVLHGSEAEMKVAGGGIVQPIPEPIVLEMGTVDEFFDNWEYIEIPDELSMYSAFDTPNLEKGKKLTANETRAAEYVGLNPYVYVDRKHGVGMLMDTRREDVHVIDGLYNDSGLKGAASHMLMQGINRSIKEGKKVSVTLWWGDDAIIDIFKRFGFVEQPQAIQDEIELVLTPENWAKFLAEEPDAITKGIVKDIDGKGHPLLYWRVFNKVDQMPDELQVAVEAYLADEASQLAKDRLMLQRFLITEYEQTPKGWESAAGIRDYESFTEPMKRAARNYYVHGDGYSSFEKLTPEEAYDVQSFVDISRRLNSSELAAIGGGKNSVGRAMEGAQAVSEVDQMFAKARYKVDEIMGNTSYDLIDHDEVRTMQRMVYDLNDAEFQALPEGTRAQIARMTALVKFMADEVEDNELVKVLGLVPEDMQERFVQRRLIHKFNMPGYGEVEIGPGLPGWEGVDISRRAIDTVNERFGAPMAWVRMAEKYGFDPDQFGEFIQKLWKTSKAFNESAEQFGKYTDDGERMVAMQKFIGQKLDIDPKDWHLISPTEMLLPATEYAPHVRMDENGIAWWRRMLGAFDLEDTRDINNRVFYRPVSTAAPHMQQQRTIQGTIEVINKMFGRDFFYDDPGRAMSQYIQEATRTLTSARMIGTLLDMRDSFGNRVVSPAMWSEANGWAAPKGYKMFKMSEMGKVGERVSALERFFPDIAGDLRQLKKNAGSIKFMAREEIVDEFEYAIRNFFADDQMAWYMKKYDQVLGIWKSFATVMRPGFHARNALSNVWQNMYAGIVDPKWYRQAQQVQYAGLKIEQFIRDEMVTTGRIWNFQSAYDEMVSRGLIKKAQLPLKVGDAVRELPLGEVYQMMKEQGVIGTGRVGSDIHVFTDQQLKALNWSSKLNPLSQSFVWTSAGRKFGEMIENNARAAHFLAMFNATGGDAAGAAWSVRKYLFDYNELTDIERNVFKRILPFYSWLRKNAELQINQLLTRPMPITTAVRVTNWLSEVDDTRYKPKWVSEIGGFALPGMTLGEVNKLANRATGGRWNLDEKNAAPMYVSVGLPYLDFLNYNGKDMFSAISPLIKVPIEVITNKDVFKDRPISEGMGDMVKAPNTIQALDKTIRTIDDPELLGRWELAMENWGLVRNELTGSVQANAWFSYIFRQMAPQLEALGKTAPSEDPEAFTQILNYWSGVKLVAADQEQTGYYEEKERAEALDQYIEMLRQQGTETVLWSELPRSAQKEAEARIKKELE